MTHTSDKGMMSLEDQLRVAEVIKHISASLDFLGQEVQRMEAELGKISGDTQAILGRIAEMDEDKQ